MSQGDQASQLWKSLIWEKTVCAGAEMRVERVMRKEEGWRAMKMISRAITTAD